MPDLEELAADLSAAFEEFRAIVATESPGAGATRSFVPVDRRASVPRMEQAVA